MRKRVPLIAMLLCLAMPSLACQAASVPAEVPEEAYAPVPYRLFPAPEGAYVGDTMPFVTQDDTLELYYLYDTDHNGQGYHPVYKYSTKNLTEYEDHGKVLDFGLMSDPDPAIGTGSVMLGQDGLYHLFYTGHNDIGNGGKGKECVMHATSEDRENWTKHPEDTFFAPENYSKDDFRDPEVFWVEEDGCYWMLLAAREETLGGVVARFTSKDLKEWTLCDPFFAPEAQYMLECPDLFCIEDTWYLTYSWDCCTYYAIGESMYGPFTAPSNNILDGRGLLESNGFIFYAAKTAELQGNTYLCGWIGRAGLQVDSGYYMWAGNILNHQLVKREDGTLGVKAPESYADYFTQEEPIQVEAEEVEGNGEVLIEGDQIQVSAEEGTFAIADLGMRLPTMRLECDVTLEGEGTAGFVFGGSEQDPSYTGLSLDMRRGMIHYDGYKLKQLTKFDPQAGTYFDFSQGGTHHLTLICENEIVVLYIDDQKALSSRITHSVDGAHIGVYAEGCSAAFGDFQIKTPAPQEG